MKYDALDCERLGSDNATREIPFIDPMKTENLKILILDGIRRKSIAPLLLICLTLSFFTLGTAQVRDRKRVTAIQLGGAAEGSRVTVVSDSTLADYEAFRRGDRFYVKLPKADYRSAAPRFRANGFEDVRAQQVGESLIVSFKLQPGATARVDQRGNRLDVVFSAPNTSSANNSTSAGSPRITGSQNSTEPAMASRERVVAERPVDQGHVSNDSRVQASPNLDTDRSMTNKKEAVPGAIAAASLKPSPLLSPTPSQSYSPVLSNTQPAAAISTPAGSSSDSGNRVDGNSGQSTVRQWMSTNRLATLLGLLILLAIIVYLVSAIRRRQIVVGESSRKRAPKVQPRYSLDSTVEPPKSEENLKLWDEDSQVTETRQPLSALDLDGLRILTMPTIVSSIEEEDDDEYSFEEEEREVFEL